MLKKQDIIARAKQYGFEDTGFTSADPFESHKKILNSRKKDYEWAEKQGLALMAGTDPKAILPTAKSIIVLMEVYFNKSYPRFMEGHFGRCYLDDDRVTRDGLSKRIKAFKAYLQDNGITVKIPFNLPHRAAAARAGMGTLGKNCLFYSGKVARKSSWVLPIALIIDHEFEPDAPTIKMGCPDWCRNACIAACPTRALKGNGAIDPRKCISYLTYFGEDLTPEPLREPMGIMVYGCDRCQAVCPRNTAWLAKDLEPSARVAAKAPFFNLSRLLHMDTAYFEKQIQPHMFYMSSKDLWRWKMNVARAMGNTHDTAYVPDLTAAFEKNSDDRVTCMIAWALGRLSSDTAFAALEKFKKTAQGRLKTEILNALSATAFSI